MKNEERTASLAQLCGFLQIKTVWSNSKPFLFCILNFLTLRCPLFLKEFSVYVRRKDYEYRYRCYYAADEKPHFVQLEVVFAVVGEFCFGAFRLYPAGKDCEEYAAYRHYQVVCNVVEEIKAVHAADFREMSADGKGRGYSEQRDEDCHNDC